MAGGEIVSADYDSAFRKRAFLSGRGDRVGDSIATLQQIRPLAEKVRVRNAEQNTVISFQITLSHNQRGLMAFPHARLVAENDALLPGRAQSESRRRNLVRVDLNIRRGVDRKQFFLL